MESVLIPFPTDSRIVLNTTDMEIDEYGRIHVAMYSPFEEHIARSTQGALSTGGGQSSAYYIILDSNVEEIVYMTAILSFGPSENLFFDLELDGCTAYMVGQAENGIGFPVTPKAYNETGTSTVT